MMVDDKPLIPRPLQGMKVWFQTIPPQYI